MGLKQWHIRQAEKSLGNHIGQVLGLGPLAAGTLAARGYDAETARRLIAGEEALLDPFLLKDMDKAVERIRAAIAGGEIIAVFGDYDCDGITATSILYCYFEMVGVRVYFYIPSRDIEGYGLNNGAIDELKKLGVSLIVTVDNGISAIDEVDYAASLGIDIVITDHHQPREILPRAVAVVNPHRPDCGYPFKDLAGAGVAFKLVSALEDDLGYETLEHFSDLLTIGTVADVVRLTGENRLFVRHGLAHLADSMRPGIQALLEHCKLTEKRLTAESVAFAIAPRINAAGRVGEPDIAVMLFLTDRLSEATEYCEQLERFNEERKACEKTISDEITAMIEADPEYLTRRTLTLYKEGWNSGTVGVVCSRIVDRYEKPCLLLSIDGDEARGSGRSLPGFSLIDAVTNSAHLLSRYGGHVQAAGFTLPADKVGAFADEVEAFAAAHYPVMPTGCLKADHEVSVSDLTLQNVAELEQLEPFGTGNETPLFVLRGANLARIMPTADGRHLRLVLMKDGREFTAVYFGMELARFSFRTGDKIDIAFHIDINLWNDKKTVNIKIKDLQLSDVDIEVLINDREHYFDNLRGACIEETLLPDREDVACLYRLIRSSGGLPVDKGYIAGKLAAQGIGYTRCALATDVLIELGLVNTTETEQGRVLVVAPVAAKVDLQKSAILGRHRQGEPAIV